MAILGLQVSVHFKGILCIAGHIFSLEVLPRCCGGEYVHYTLCLGCGPRVLCGARLCGNACLVKSITVQYGVCLHPARQVYEFYSNSKLEQVFFVRYLPCGVYVF